MTSSWIGDSALRRLADLVRVLTLVSAGAAYFWVNGEGALRFLLLFVVLVGVRLFRLPPLFDLLVAAALLTSMWAAVMNWYVTVAWMDETMHFFTVAILAAATYLALARIEVLPDLRVLAQRQHRLSVPLVVTVLGFGIATVWEFYEWVAEQFSPKTIHVGYTDTVLDLALGGLGALVAGLVLAFSSRRFVDGRAARHQEESHT